jgi:hypothetical protein
MEKSKIEIALDTIKKFVENIEKLILERNKINEMGLEIEQKISESKIKGDQLKYWFELVKLGLNGIPIDIEILTKKRKVYSLSLMLNEYILKQSQSPTDFDLPDQASLDQYKEEIKNDIHSIKKAIFEIDGETKPVEEIGGEFEKINLAWGNFLKKSNKDYQKTLKRLKHIFKKHETIIPNQLEEFGIWKITSNSSEFFSKNTLEMIENLSIKDKDLLMYAKEYSENIKLEEPEKVEAYTNLPHALCILDDLGILDLIEKKFSDKHYKGKARETDKAKLIATILGIEDAQKIRHPLKNKDYLSDKAKQNAVKTLKTLGLDPSKFTDYSF